jgi:hypothetical protein
MAAKAKKEERYFLDRDNSSHWYLIPVSKADAWYKFSAIDEDDPRGWKVPKWAKPIGGSPTMVTFTDPKID